MKKRRYILQVVWGLVFTIGISSCCVAQRPVARVDADNNSDYKVDYLFEHDGCKGLSFF
jgi:hypothetical protein